MHNELTLRSNTNDTSMTVYRARMRFSKAGDLRWISHRDLVRTFERMFRRAGVQLGMTQGFHPRPKLTFPSALALGVAASDEVMEFLLAEDADPQELQSRIQASAPEGLSIGDLQILTIQDPKVTVQRVTYVLPLPAECSASVKEQAQQISSADTHVVAREDGSEIDVRKHLEDLSVADGQLQMTFAVDASGGAKPTDILRALQLETLLQQGRYLTRTKVETRT